MPDYERHLKGYLEWWEYPPRPMDYETLEFDPEEIISESYRGQPQECSVTVKLRGSGNA